MKTTAPRPASLRMALVALPFFVTLYQLLAKHLADAAPQHAGAALWLRHLFTAPLFAILIGAEVVSFALWMYLLARIPLSMAFPLSALSYILVLLASWVLFHESVSLLQGVGMAAISGGIWLVGRQGIDAASA